MIGALAPVGAFVRATDRPLLAYPNAGETYDPATRSWASGEPAADPLDAAADWIAAGVFGVGFVAPLFPADDLAGGHWDAIEARAARCMAAVRGA